MTTPKLDPLFLQLQTLLAGRFSLEREIGRGGMGVVYVARDVALERPVAIKVLAPALATRPEMRERFLREARVAAKCFHPHIVPIHAVEEAEGLAWIVMAYVRGETLADRLRRQGTLDPAETLRLAREVGWALSYAHDRGVVHRDIKPENLLIDASTERFLIADFGIAQYGQESITPIGTAVVGTARYMAPEQAAGDLIDGRADLFALGVTLFIASSGRPPFDSGSLRERALAATAPAPSVRLFAPNVPLPLARAIDRCLALSPDLRYRDAGQFLSAIEPDVREQPLALSLHATRNHAAVARTMLFWSAVIEATTLVTVLGEEPGSLGRALVLPIGQGIAALCAVAALMRAAEAILGARRALRRGHDQEEVTRALAAPDVSTSELARDESRVGAATLVVVGVALAWLQGQLGALHLPDAVQGVAELVALFAPPLLIARGAGSLMVSSGLSRSIRERLTTPIARVVTGYLARFRGADGKPASRPELADAPTELLLLRAVEAALDSASGSPRSPLGDAEGIARQLAEQAGALRRDLRQLDAQESDALLLQESEARERALDRMREARVVTQSRLQTAVAALESLRLEVLLYNEQSTTHGLTSQLEAVREVQRRVDAAREVRRLLATPTP